MQIQKVDTKTLEVGTYNYTFHLDGAFFAEIQANVERLDDFSRVISADITSRFDIEVAEHYVMLRYGVDGIVSVPCGRCCAAVEVPIEAREEIEAEDDIVDMGWLIYELVMLTLPAVNMHDEDDCDPEVMKILGRYSREQADDENLSDNN